MVNILHVEVARNPASHLKTADVLRLLQETIGALENPVADFCLQKTKYAHLKEHIDSIKFCSGGSTCRTFSSDARREGNKQVIRNACKQYDKLEYYIFKLNEEAESTEFIDDDDEDGHSHSSCHWMLPSLALHDLWDSLVLKSDVKVQLIDYIRTGVLYSEKLVNDSLISWNKVILLYGPPGNGKTSLCKALAHKATIRLGSRFDYGQLVEINSHSLFSKWFSESGKLILKMFEKIQELIDDPHSIVFLLIDEVESLAKSRLSSDSSLHPSDTIRAVNALLAQIDRIKKYPNVVILATSNMVGTIDVAFIDRADMKIFIGNPVAEVIYEILASSINELIRVGIVKPEEEVLIPQTHRDISKSDGSYAYARQLVEIARSAVGLSGRALRKIPFLAHVQYAKSDEFSLGEFLEWMRKTVLKEKEDLTFVNRSGLQRMELRSERSSEGSSPGFKEEGGPGTRSDDSKERAEVTKEFVSSQASPRPGRSKRIMESSKSTTNDVPKNSHNETKSDSKLGSLVQSQFGYREGSVKRKSSEETSLSKENALVRSDCFIRSSTVASGKESINATTTKRKPAFGNSSKGFTKKTKVEENSGTEDEIVSPPRTRLRASSTTDSSVTKNQRDLRPRSAKVVTKDQEVVSCDEVSVVGERRVNNSSSLTIPRRSCKNEILRVKECYIDLSKSICSPKDVLEYTKRRSTQGKSNKVKSNTDISQKSVSSEDVSKAIDNNIENEISVLSTAVKADETTHQVLLPPSAATSDKLTNLKNPITSSVQSLSTAGSNQPSVGGSASFSNSLPSEETIPKQNSSKLNPPPAPASVACWPPSPIMLNGKPSVAKKTNSVGKPTEYGEKGDDKPVIPKSGPEVTLISANSIKVASNAVVQKDVVPIRPVQRVAAVKTESSYLSSRSDGFNSFRKGTITPAMKSIYPRKVAGYDSYGNSDVEEVIITNVTSVSASMLPSKCSNNNSQLKSKAIVSSIQTLNCGPVGTMQESATLVNQNTHQDVPSNSKAIASGGTNLPVGPRRKLLNHGPLSARIAAAASQNKGNGVMNKHLQGPLEKNPAAKLPNANGNALAQSIPRGKKSRCFVCESCNVSFYFKRELNSHMRQAHPTPGQCSICKKTFSDTENVKRHENLCKKKLKEPSDKPKVIISFEAAQTPPRVAYGSQASPVSKSDSRKTPSRTTRPQTPSPLQLLERKLGEEELGKKMEFTYGAASPKRSKFACMDCSEVFTNEKDLKKHDIIHQDERPYECRQCSKTFKRESSRNFHIRIAHETSEDCYTCTICGMIFSSEPEVANHENNVHFLQSTPSFDVPETPLSQATTESSSVSPVNNSDCDQSLSFCGTPFTDNVNDSVLSNHSTDNFRGVGNSVRVGHIESVDFPLSYQHCSICGECFLHDFELTQHQQSFHQPPTPTPVQPTSNNNEYFLQDNIPVPDAETVIEVETTDEFLTFLSAF